MLLICFKLLVILEPFDRLHQYYTMKYDIFQTTAFASQLFIIIQKWKSAQFDEIFFFFQYKIKTIQFYEYAGMIMFLIWVKKGINCRSTSIPNRKIFGGELKKKGNFILKWITFDQNENKNAIIHSDCSN